jgi:hypothetical protein
MILLQFSWLKGPLAALGDHGRAAVGFLKFKTTATLELL